MTNVPQRTSIDDDLGALLEEPDFRIERRCGAGGDVAVFRDCSGATGISVTLEPISAQPTPDERERLLSRGTAYARIIVGKNHLAGGYSIHETYLLGDTRFEPRIIRL